MNTTRLFAMAAMAALAVTAVADGERNSYMCTVTYGSGWSYFNSDATPTTASAVAADKGCDLTIVQAINDNKQLDTSFELHSLTIAKTNDTGSLKGPWADGGGVFTLREGGLHVAANNLFRLATWRPATRMKLAESQTWSGPATGTTYGEFDIGCNNTWSTTDNGVPVTRYYDQTKVIALKDLTWTLDGRIRVALTGTNDLSNVDIVVNPKARLMLVEKCGNYTSGARLNAKSLTLKGGDTDTTIPMLTVGAANPSSAFGTSYAPTSFDDLHFSPRVNLENGASVNGGTVDYSVSALYVTGGDSTFSGTVTFKTLAAIDIASGASLTFTGDLTADEGAGIDLTGGGSLKFAKNLIALPVCGDGTILCDPGADDETVLGGDLSSFTGTIHVASGTLMVRQDATVNASATITTAEGASVHYMDASDYGDFTKNGKTYYRDSAGVIHQHLYMNEFTGNKGWDNLSFREVPDVEQTAPWVQGSVCVIDRKMGGGIGNYSKVNMEGIIVESTATFTGLNYFDGSSDLMIGERGIEFRRNNCTLDFFKNFNYLKLAESQTWKGPAAETLSSSPARINVGGNWNNKYETGSVTAMKELDLTLEGDLYTLFYYPSNDMTRINLIVKKPAKVTLSYPGGHKDYTALPASKKWIGRLNAKSLTFDGAVSLVIDNSGNYPVISSEFLARKIILKNGAAFGLSGKKWTGVAFAAGAGGGSMAGTYSLLDDVFTLEASAGATLDASGATFNQAAGGSTSLALVGPGTIRLAVEKILPFSNAIAVDGASLELSGNGAWTAPLASAGGLTIDSAGTICVSAAALAGYEPAEINVTSGTLMLDSVLALPQGCKVVTSGTGALALVDPDGFDADVHMGGTQNIVVDSSLVITDTPRENETLAVPAGQTLHVFGSGLKASSSVSLGDGASIIFHETATIYAPVAVTGAATIKTATAEAEGTFAGAFTLGNTSADTGACEVWADGGIVFAGGGNVYRAPLRQCSGRIVIKDKQFSLRNSGGGFRMYAGHCTITNCTAYSINYGDWYLNMADQTSDVTLEVVKSGTLKLDNNSRLYIGRSTNFVSRLLLNGGTFTHATYDAMYINQDGDGNGVFDFAAGSFITQRRFITGFKPGKSIGSAKFIWRGGTWSTTSSGYPYRYHHLIESADIGDGGLEFIIAGTNCVLDLTNFLYPDSISNFNGGVSTMIGMPGAKLTIKGKAGVASNMTFVRSTMNGLALDLNPVPSCNVDIVGDGNDIALGWVVPGTGGVVRCVGTASPLVADYVVPGGATFRNGYVGDGWHSGFASAVARDLVFWDGATYMLCPTAQGFEPISFTGAVRTSGTVRYDVDRSGGALPEGEGFTLVNAPGGCEGDGTWAAANGTLGRKSRVYGGEGALLFDHRPISFRIYFR